MKILKKGIPPSNIVYEGKCMFCKTEIEFFRKEAIITHDQRDGDYLTIPCPVCDNPIVKSL